MRVMSFVGTNDVMDALVNSSTPMFDEIYVDEKSQKSQATLVEFISIISSSSHLLELLATVHHVSSVFSSFSRCLKFSPEFFQSSISPANVILLVVPEVRLLRKLMSFVFLSFRS